MKARDEGCRPIARPDDGEAPARFTEEEPSERIVPETVERLRRGVPEYERMAEITSS